MTVFEKYKNLCGKQAQIVYRDGYFDLDGKRCVTNEYSFVFVTNKKVKIPKVTTPGMEGIVKKIMPEYITKEEYKTDKDIENDVLDEERVKRVVKNCKEFMVIDGSRYDKDQVYYMLRLSGLKQVMYKLVYPENSKHPILFLFSSEIGSCKNTLVGGVLPVK